MLPNKNFFQSYSKEKKIPWQEKNILLEYLQTQILKSLSLSKYNASISFLGGTCLRFVYDIDRFSEDLDFDLVDKENFDINNLEGTLKKALELQGFHVDTRVKKTDVIYIVFFKFKNVLQEFGFNVRKNEKLLIKFKIDFSPYKNIKTGTIFVDSFNERFPLLVNDIETLFAQKVLAIIFRPYQKGRDFYDLVWFLSQKNIEPNYAIFKEKNIPVTSRKELIAFLMERAGEMNLLQAAKDVERFLFYPQQAKWIEKLPEYLKNFDK